MNEKITQNNGEEKYPLEDVNAHPELSHEIKDHEKRTSRHLFGFQKTPHSVKYIWLLNQPFMTNIIHGFSIVLAFIFMFFGVTGALTLVGNTENTIWKIYEATWIFGWEGNAITGVALIIIAIVMLWSIPYYFKDDTQKADSYLIIGAGVGILFGIIYLFVILADILSWLIEFFSTNEFNSLETYFYYPILLALITFPLFRVLTIRHIVLPPSQQQPEDYTVQQYIEDTRRWHRKFNDNYYRQNGNWKHRKGYGHHKRRKRWE